MTQASVSGVWSAATWPAALPGNSWRRCRLIRRRLIHAVSLEFGAGACGWVCSLPGALSKKLAVNLYEFPVAAVTSDHSSAAENSAHVLCYGAHSEVCGWSC